MQLSPFQSLVHAAAPIVSVHADVTRTSAAGSHEVELRSAALRKELERDGAPSIVVDAVIERLLSPTHAAGEQGRTVIATTDGVLLDRVLPLRPMRDIAHVGIAAHLLPLIRGLSRAVPYILMRLDRTGADVTVVDDSGTTVDDRQVEGGHDVVHKVPGGGWAHRRYQSRVEDSWERNAAVVAKDLDDAVARHRPSLVMLAGDVRAAAELRKYAGKRALELLVDLDTGGREAGISDEAMDQAVENALVRARMERMGNALARFEQERGRGAAAAEGLARVVEALRGGQVDTLLLQDDPTSTLTLWTCADPMLLGTTPDDVRALGGTDVVEERADAVLLRALTAQDGKVELVEAGKINDGVGAILRFDTTPARPTA